MAIIDKKEAKDLFNDKRLFTVKQVTLTQYQPFHWHDFYEIEYILDGSGEYIINGIAHEIKPQALFFSTPSDFHEITFHNPTTIIKVQFLPEMINSDLYSLLDTPVVLNDEDNAFRLYLAHIYTHSKNFDNYSQLFINHIINALLILITTSRNQTDGKKLYTVNEHFHKVLSYINNHFTEEISLHELSKKVNLSPDYLSTLFKKHSGQKISDYITTIRLNHAYKLIKNTNMTINEICYSCGYNSYPHFIRTFKAKYGNSPNQMRKALRQPTDTASG